MDVVILSARSGWHTDELCRALAERGGSGRVVPYESLVARLGVRTGLSATAMPDRAAASPPFAVFDADAVLPRIIPDGSLEQIIFRVDALHWIEDRGIPVVNAART